MANSLLVLHEKIKHCSECGNLTEEDPCSICVDPFRNRKLLCVVETQEDCVAMEQSTVFDGLYHVLGGRFSPLDEETIPSESLLKLKDRDNIEYKSSGICTNLYMLLHDTDLHNITTIV